MKAKPIILFALAASSAVTAVSANAPHPTVLLIKYRDAIVPVQKVLDTDPVIRVAGREKRIRTAQVYFPERTLNYRDGTAVIVGASVAGMKLALAADPVHGLPSFAPSAKGREGPGYYEITLNPRNLIKGGFVLIGLFSPRTFSEKNPRRPARDTRSIVTAGPGAENPGFATTQVLLHSLPDLPAGQATVVRFTARSLRPRMNPLTPATQPEDDSAAAPKFFLQVFGADGLEVQTNIMRLAWEYYGQLERAKLESAIEVYRKKFAGVDHEPAPVVMVNPLTPEAAIPNGTTIVATLLISEHGSVAEVSFDKTADQQAAGAMREALGGWLFLPRLKAGQPVASRVQVPVKF